MHTDMIPVWDLGPGDALLAGVDGSLVVDNHRGPIRDARHQVRVGQVSGSCTSAECKPDGFRRQVEIAGDHGLEMSDGLGIVEVVGFRGC